MQARISTPRVGARLSKTTMFSTRRRQRPEATSFQPMASTISSGTSGNLSTVVRVISVVGTSSSTSTKSPNLSKPSQCCPKVALQIPRGPTKKFRICTETRCHCKGQSRSFRRSALQRARKAKSVKARGTVRASWLSTMLQQFSQHPREKERQAHEIAFTSPGSVQVLRKVSEECLQGFELPLQMVVANKRASRILHLLAHLSYHLS